LFFAVIVFLEKNKGDHEYDMTAKRLCAPRSLRKRKSINDEKWRNSPSTPHSSIFLLMASSFCAAVFADADSLTLSIVAVVPMAVVVALVAVVVGSPSSAADAVPNRRRGGNDDDDVAVVGAMPPPRALAIAAVADDG